MNSTRRRASGITFEAAHSDPSGRPEIRSSTCGPVTPSSPTKIGAPLVRPEPGVSIVRMRQVLALPVAVMTLLTFGACASRTVRAPQPPDDDAAPRTEAPAPRDRRDLTPRLIAPPPAYGNKVVMTAGASTKPDAVRRF